jgi:cytochrome b pre-mRNA-processing protein 3
MTKHTDIAKGLYTRIVEQARKEAFYRSCGVPDSVDGRFESIAVHCFLILYRIKNEDEEGADLAQALFDVMFVDMDDNVREMGVSDVSVGAEVKRMARSLLGRVAAYDSTLEVNGDETGDDRLETALDNNLYGTIKVSKVHLGKMADYMRRETLSLSTQPFSDLLAGVCRFGSPPS